MSDLHPEARALIDAAKRREAGLPRASLTRVHQSVLRRGAALGAAVGTTTSASVAAKAGALANVLASPLAKLGLLGALAGGALFVGRAAWMAPTAPASLTLRVPVSVSVAASGDRPHRALRAAEIPPAIATAVPESTAPPRTSLEPTSGGASPEPRLSSPPSSLSSLSPPRSSPSSGPRRDPTGATLGAGPRSERSVAAPREASTALPQDAISGAAGSQAGSGGPALGAGEVASTTDLSMQLTLLHLVHGALRDGQPARALSYLDRHGAMPPGGPLTEEADAARISALCKLGRESDAHAAMERFVSAWPGSPLVTRMQVGCPAFRGTAVGPTHRTTAGTPLGRTP
jgi:hypothetical protein